MINHLNWISGLFQSSQKKLATKPSQSKLAKLGFFLQKQKRFEGTSYLRSFLLLRLFLLLVSLISLHSNPLFSKENKGFKDSDSKNHKISTHNKLENKQEIGLVKSLEISEQTLSILVSKEIKFKIFTLENPSRIVIDLENTRFAKEFEQKKLPNFVENFRFHQQESDLRIVFGLNSQVKIENSGFQKANNSIICNFKTQNSKSALQTKDQSSETFNNAKVDSKQTNSESKPKYNNSDQQKTEIDNNLNKLISKISKNGERVEINPITGIITEISKESSRKYKLRNFNSNIPKTEPPDDKNTKIISFKSKPVIVIDAGHGGKDPGTIGIFARSQEKNITLSYAKELAKTLAKTQNYQVFLTRNSDKFIPLKERVQKARSKKADLFISLHANAIEDNSVSGFSIYTLSEKSSDKQAEILAKKENRADIINGINFSDSSPEIMKTLIDLAQRDSKNSSAKFAQFVIEKMKKEEIEILQNSHRFAGFMVLTAPDMTSVLIELGYLSNKNEEKLINSLGYRRLIAQSIAKAVDDYFQNS